MPRPVAHARRRARRGLLAMLPLGAALWLTLPLGRGAAHASAPRSDEPGQVAPSPPAMPVVVSDGRAWFPLPAERSLVVVSTLAQVAGPFPARLTARPARLGQRPPMSMTPFTLPASTTRPSPPSLPPVMPLTRRWPPASRTFHLLVRDGDVSSASNYEAIRGLLKAVGERVQIYVDAEDAQAIEAGVLRDIVETFDAWVHPLAARTIGQAADVDGDGRFTVFLSGRLRRLGGGRHPVDGFVRGADLDPNLPAPFSNHGDMMYLSTALQPGPHLRTVLAHEYTHAVTFSVRSALRGESRDPAVDEEGWLDEAIAHIVEDMHGFSKTNLDYRVSAFLSRPERYRLVVDDYFGADLFRGHGNRGATYLFLRWCVDRLGPDLLPVLVHSRKRGVANLEEATGVSFEDLYRAWSLALFRDGLDPTRGNVEGFRTLTTRGPLDDWELAGPRPEVVAPDGTPAVWASAGTASHYVIVDATSLAGRPVDVEVLAPPSAALQVTVLPLPDDLASLDLEAESTRDPDGRPALRFNVTERKGTPVRLTSLAWEPLVPGPDPHAAAFRHDALDQLGIASAFGTSALPGMGQLTSRPVGAGQALSGGVLLVFKVVGTDARGRRVAAWAEGLPRESLASPAPVPPTGRENSTQNSN